MRGWFSEARWMAALAVLLFGACDGEAGTPPPSSGTGSDRAGDGADGGAPRTRIIPMGAPVGDDGAPGAAGAGDRDGDGVGDEPADRSAQTLCDADCGSALGCAATHACLQFSDGMRCAPSECAECEHGCVYDLNECGFSHCTSPPTVRNTCGQLCQSTKDCAADQVCVDVFGLGECAPVQCLGCDGFCDYQQDLCEFDACYRDDGCRPMPVYDYCPHVF